MQDIIGSMKFKGSEENQLFYNYQQFTQQKTTEAKPINEELMELEKDSKKYKKLKKELDIISKEVINFKLDYMEKYPNKFFKQLLKQLKELRFQKHPY